MEYVKLGSTELMVSKVGFGCWLMGGHGWGQVDDNLSIRAVQEALARGVNFFDTADVYGFGHSEELLSKALGQQRNHVIIATKFGVSWDERGKIGRDASPKYIVKALDASLKRLRVDCIPLYQIHWPDPQTPIEETMATLKNCQKEGKIRYIGCSNYSSSLIEKAQKICNLDSMQLPYSIINNDVEDDVISLKKNVNISFIAFDVLAKGLLSGKFTEGSRFNDNDVRSRDENFRGDKFDSNLKIVDNIKGIADRYKKTPAQVAIRWVLDSLVADCVIVGIRTPEQIRDNIGSVHWRLSESEWINLKQCVNR